MNVPRGWSTGNCCTNFQHNQAGNWTPADSAQSVDTVPIFWLIFESTLVYKNKFCIKSTQFTG